MDLPSKTLHPAILSLLMLVMAMHSVLVFGQVTENPTNSYSWAEPAMMDCCKGGLHTPSNPSGDGMTCGDMNSADCALAASLGNCGSVVSALVPEKTDWAAQTATGLKHLHPHDGYLSVILDTLTPPPDSSKA